MKVARLFRGLLALGVVLSLLLVVAGECWGAREAGVQGMRGVGDPGCQGARDGGDLACRGAGVQGSSGCWGSGVLGIRGAKNPGCRASVVLRVCGAGEPRCWEAQGAGDVACRRYRLQGERIWGAACEGPGCHMQGAGVVRGCTAPRAAGAGAEGLNRTGQGDSGPQPRPCS